MKIFVRRLRLPVMLLSLLLPAAFAGAERGHLVLIGGGVKPPEAMRKFVELAGGPHSPIIIIPTASGEPDAPEYYEKLFREGYGCTDVLSLRIKSPADARKPEFVAAAARARGVFFGGGDQIRILNALAGSPVLEKIREGHAGGAVIGGNSAGTACQSAIMITGEGDFTVIQSRSVETWEGLGFLRGIVVDQHFVARQRLNRLISVILEHPDQLGVGVDEDTAIWIRPDDTFQVMGARSVMVFDAAGSAVSRQARETGQEVLGVRDMRVHVLLPGEAFSVRRRAPLAR